MTAPEQTNAPEAPAVGGPVERPVRPDPKRAAFEAWARENRRDLDLRYMYDAQGNYHFDGYIWEDTSHAYRAWLAGAEAHKKGPVLPVGWAIEYGVGGFYETRWVCIRHLESQCGQDFYEDRDPLIFGFLAAMLPKA